MGRFSFGYGVQTLHCGPGHFAQGSSKDISPERIQKKGYVDFYYKTAKDMLSSLKLIARDIKRRFEKEND